MHFPTLFEKLGAEESGDSIPLKCYELVASKSKAEQEQELKRQGIQLSRQTMSNWVLTASEKLLFPIYERLHRELLSREVLHADETTLQVLHEPGKKPTGESYMWLYRTSGDGKEPIVLYEYQPQNIRGNSSAGFTGICIRTAMPDTTIYRRRSRWSAAGHMPGKNLTRQ